jgi:DNA-binding NarL/FixJ family response regulator
MDDLTELEKRILSNLADGLKNHEIARVLGCRPQTVANRIPMIYRKLSVTNRVAAALRWRQQEMADDHHQRQ